MKQPRKPTPFISPFACACIAITVFAVFYVFFRPTQGDAQDRQQLALARCAQLYSDPHFNDLTFGMTEEKDLCRRHLPHFRDMVHTRYSIVGSSFRLIDSTHALAGLSVARGRSVRDRAAPELAALAIFSDEKLVATLQFGDPALVDKAFDEISNAIAVTHMLQIISSKDQP